MLLLSKQFVFNLFDMNCDGSIDQADLFSFFKDVKNESLFEQAAYDDIRCIN